MSSGSQSPSPNYLLRVEGVNLSEVIDDTNQLSVRRGGGLLLLNTPRALRNQLPPSLGLRDVVTGASIGLFEFTADSVEHAQQIRETVAQHLARQSLAYGTEAIPFQHATYVVDVAPLADGQHQAAVEQAVAANRWRQLQQPTVPLAGLWPDPPASEPCALDKTRPGPARRSLPGESRPQPVSRSAWDRFQFGRHARSDFYRDETGVDCATTDNLQNLADISPTEVPPNLAGKVAVLYLDGNKFGSLANQALQQQGVAGLRQFSEAVRKHHQTLLRGLLDLLGHDPTGLKGPELRLETLLWGGDEIIWVLPAWKGWEVVQWFFSQSHRLPGTNRPTPGPSDLTYSAGLVFAHSNAPIQGLTRLARGLGDLAKESSAGPDPHSTRHRLAYEVLESYDDVAVDLVRHRRRFVPAEASVDQLVLDPRDLAAIWFDLQTAAGAKEWPRRQLYRLVNAWRRGENIEQPGDTLQRVRQALKETGIEPERLESSLGQAAWHHLLQMLPYLTGHIRPTGEPS